MEKKPRIARIAIAALILIAIITIIIIATTGKENSGDAQGNSISTKSEFDNMEAKDVKISYNEETDRTSLSYTIKNTSNEEVRAQTINVMLLDENDVEITGIQTYVEFIDAKAEFKGTAELAGHFANAKKLDLQRPEISE